MKKEVFDGIDVDELYWRCFEPIIPAIRGKDHSIKTLVYNQLTLGQQALLMFNVYYNHASKSLVEFYWWSAYYLSQPNSWEELKKALQYFNSESMLNLLEELEKLLAVRTNPQVSYTDLEHKPELSTSMNKLYYVLQEISPSIKLNIGCYIKRNQHEFIEFID